MPYQLGYGNAFATPGVAGGLFEGAREQTDFTRSVERTKLALEARRTDIQAAQLAASRSAAEIQAQQVQRQFDDRAKEWRANNRRARDELRLRQAQEQRLAEQHRRNAQLELRRLEARDSERQAKQADVAREEANALAERGARPLGEDRGLLPGEVSYQAMDGRTYAVRGKEAADLDQLQSELRLRAGEEARTAAYSPQHKRLLENLDRDVSRLMQRRGQFVQEQQAIGEQLKALRDGIMPETNAEGEKMPEYERRNAATRKAIADLEAKLAAADTAGLDRQVDVFALYRQAAARNPRVLDLVTPEVLARIDWAEVTATQWDAVRVLLEDPTHPDAGRYFRALVNAKPGS